MNRRQMIQAMSGRFARNKNPTRKPTGGKKSSATKKQIDWAFRIITDSEKGRAVDLKDVQLAMRMVHQHNRARVGQIRGSLVRAGKLPKKER